MIGLRPYQIEALRERGIKLKREALESRQIIDRLVFYCVSGCQIPIHLLIPILAINFEHMAEEVEA